MKNTLKFALTALLLAAAPMASAETVNCIKLSQAVKSAASVDSSKVVQIVAANVSANPSCACDIVKAAIVGSDADSKLVAKIVNAAILEAPSELRMIVQCAIATAPDAISKIQAIAEKYDSAGGEGYSEKGGLDDGKGDTTPPVDGPNPLDYPFESLNDPIVKERYRWLPEFFGEPIDDDPNVTSPLNGSGSSSSAG